MGQERGPGGVVSDTQIKTVLNAKWAKDDSKILDYVDLNIFEGRVLLTGNVPNPQIRDEAVADARKVDGVKEVINNITIGQRSTVGSTASDNWILTRLRSGLTFDGKISSLNYSLQVVDGVVYILGSAKDHAEKDLVINHARNTPDVVKVVSYIRLRPGSPNSDAGSSQTYVKPTNQTPVVDGNSGGSSDTDTGSGSDTSPSYTPPSYAAPSATAPTYTPPSYNAPLPAKPSYTAPSYTAPSYTAPSYTVPSYTAPSYSAPKSLAPPASVAPPASSGGSGAIQEQPL
jgi:osmotically-inducible protein OsmY